MKIENDICLVMQLENIPNHLSTNNTPTSK